MGLLSLFLLAGVGALIYFGVKGRMIRLREEFAEAMRRATQGGAKKPIATEEMVKCPTCGTYAVPTQQKNCGKPGCPYK